MKSHAILVLTLVTLGYTNCTKDELQLPASEESKAETPELIYGKWNLLKQTDTTYYTNHFTASSATLKDWFYSFNKSGILKISNNNFVDSFTYNFVNTACIKIGWVGWQGNSYIDTIVTMNKTDLVIKHWNTNFNNSKTKQVFYLSK